MNPAIEQGKRLIRAHVQADLASKLAELRKRHPDKNTPELWKELQAEQGELLAQASRIENNQWGPAPRASLVHAVKKPSARSKPEDDSQIFVVYAADGTVAGLELK